MLLVALAIVAAATRVAAQPAPAAMLGARASDRVAAAMLLVRADDHSIVVPAIVLFRGQRGWMADHRVVTNERLFDPWPRGAGEWWKGPEAYPPLEGGVLTPRTPATATFARNENLLGFLGTERWQLEGGTTVFLVERIDDVGSTPRVLLRERLPEAIGIPMPARAIASDSSARRRWRQDAATRVLQWARERSPSIGRFLDGEQIELRPDPARVAATRYTLLVQHADVARRAPHERCFVAGDFGRHDRTSWGDSVFVARVGLRPLRDGWLPDTVSEVRIRIGGWGMSSYLLRLQRNGDRVAGALYRWTTASDPFGRSGSTTRRSGRCRRTWSDRHATICEADVAGIIPWDLVLARAESAHVRTLPDALMMSPAPLVLDGVGVRVEVRDGSCDRTYAYANPGRDPRPEYQDAAALVRLVSDVALVWSASPLR